METVIHVKVPDGWYAGLKSLAEDSEGTINQQTRLAIRERLERKGILSDTKTENKNENSDNEGAAR